MEFVRLCWRDLWRNPRRTALTGLVMGFSVACMVAFVALNDGSHRQMIESATDTLLGHAQVQQAGFREQPDLEHVIAAPELQRLGAELSRAAGVRAWAPRLVSGGLVSRKTVGDQDDGGEGAGPDDDGGDAGADDGSARAEGAVVLGVDPARERQVSRLAASLLPDDPRGRCLRGCLVASGRGADGVQARCEALCARAGQDFQGAPCRTAGRELCGEPCADDDDACRADDCLDAWTGYCEPARFLAEVTPWPDQPWRGEAVIGSGLARVLGVDVGDTLALTTGTAAGRSFASLYRVAGVVHSGSSELNRSMLLTQVDKLAAGLDVPGAASAVVLALDDPTRAPQAAADLDPRVRAIGPELRAWSWRDLSPELYLFVQLDSASLLITVTLVTTVVGVILMNVVTMAVLERTREYGVRMAVGESPRRILWSLVAEMLLLSLLAGACGVAVGEVATWVLHVRGVDLGVDQVELAGVLANAVIHGDFSWFGPLYAQGTVMAFSVLGTLPPAWRIHRLRPVDALRFT